MYADFCFLGASNEGCVRRSGRKQKEREDAEAAKAKEDAETAKTQSSGRRNRPLEDMPLDQVVKIHESQRTEPPMFTSHATNDNRMLDRILKIHRIQPCCDEKHGRGAERPTVVIGAVRAPAGQIGPAQSRRLR